MRILHLSTSDIRGGAARGAYFLHRKLREMGVDSQMLVGRKHSDDASVTQLCGPFAPVSERLRGRLDALPLRRYDKTDDSFWTVGWQPRRLARVAAAWRADIVHLHWTGGGFLPVDGLRGLRTPVVWTLRDMWAFTGGCHYTAGCQGFTEGCGRCPQLDSDRPDDLSRAVVERKRRAWRDLDLRLVPISDWLGRHARASPLFRNTPMDVIPNGIDCAHFAPMDKRAARRALGLPAESRLVVFSALNALVDVRKGFWHLVDALAVLGRDHDGPPAELAVAGDATAEDMPATGVPVRLLGRIDDDRRLAILYAAADVVAAPSLQEAFGKVHIEAMACGTPVVAFDHGGPSEIVQHKETGYLAAPFDCTDLARGLAWCLESVAQSGALGRAARARAEAHFDTGVVARRYIAHYQAITRQAA